MKSSSQFIVIPPYRYSIQFIRYHVLYFIIVFYNAILYF